MLFPVKDNSFELASVPLITVAPAETINKNEDIPALTAPIALS